jgi:ElaB/YqjD/DUF883 family membrane-anchored ribosome-binding protein
MATSTNPRADVPLTPRNRGDADAPHVSPVTPDEDIRTVVINQVSWGAVLAGVVFALAIQLIVNMIGVGVGAATIDPGTADNPTTGTFSMIAGLWWLLSGIMGALLGGYAAGRLAGVPKESTAGWHGLIAWAATTLVVIYLLSSAVGSVLGGAFSTVTAGVSGAANAAGAAAQANPSGANSALSSITNAIRGTNGANADAAIAAVQAFLTGDPSQANEARESAAQALAQSQNIPIEQARTQVQQYEQQYRATATQTADTATKAVSWGTILGAIGLLLGALAGWFGGRMGAVDPTITGTSGFINRDWGPGSSRRTA